MTKFVPFVANKEDDLHCVAAVFRMVHQFYFGTDASWEEMDKIGSFVAGKGMWTFPFELWLAKKGVQIKSIEQVDYKLLYSQPIEYLRATFGEKNADYYLNKSNLIKVLMQIPEYILEVEHQIRSVKVEEIVELVKNGFLVACEVNSQLLNGLEKFNLHLILIYDFQDGKLMIHDPGLPPIAGRRLTLDEFNSCFNYPGGNPGAILFSK